MKEKETVRVDFESRSHNEQFARVVAAVFAARLDPTVEEVEDIKTAVSEAVTNAVIHGYETGRGSYIWPSPSRAGPLRWRSGTMGGDPRREKGHGAPLHLQAGKGALRDGLFLYGGLYGSGERGIGAGKGNHGADDKTDRKRRPSVGRAACMDEMMELIRSAHAGDKEARNRLVAENMGLVWSVVRRFLGRGHEPEDLFQIGSIGLIKAIDKFDTSFEVRFSTYAVP